MLEENVVVLGGSFDPIHNTHLTIALESAKCVGAKMAILIPAHQSPLKNFAPKVNDAHRLAMLKIALEDFPLKSEICTYELEEKSISYTIDSVKFLLKSHKNIYWIIGSDQYEQLHRWKDIEILASLIKFCHVKRPNYSTKNDALPKNIQIIEVNCPLSELSSTQIREKLAKQDLLNVEISSKLVLYIRENKLYQL